ncbi:prephenate dehydratase [Erythrobacter sp. 3-20A1M]|uniref:prephenate dehydratase n=1 Tax=Erythrobacter sp. 3-20A1M TaxID=2653850 RepID=UPI001BFCD2EB|nr:prephenate dehydratase [Erythrobacter sp. 3-20A1M]QWC57105.1 prephenate dehydratase [Erythrobacter sp. 3-20A1M]
MSSFPGPALAMVEKMRAAAAAQPHRAIALQGSPGANSHRAAQEYAPDMLPLPCFSFRDAIEAVQQGTAGCAIIPIENSQHGRVADIHFLLPGSGLKIVGEHFMRIEHALMGLTKGPYTAAYSHPQALGQSAQFLRERSIVPLSHADTAGAAAFVKERGDPSLAAIAPAIAADLYGLEIAERNVEDASDNTTRFVVLAQEGINPADLIGETAMTTFVFEVKNIPAALYKALGCFATNGVNMTKLESYQQGASFAATTFYADIEGVPGEARVDTALEELAFQTSAVRLLGSYRQARKRG